MSQLIIFIGKLVGHKITVRVFGHQFMSFWMAPSVPKAASVSVTFPQKLQSFCVVPRKRLHSSQFLPGNLLRLLSCQADAVLPDVGSMMVLPGVRSPLSSACSIIFKAMRSLILPVGLNPSIWHIRGYEV